MTTELPTKLHGQFWNMGYFSLLWHVHVLICFIPVTAYSGSNCCDVVLIFK